ncbi:glycosyltransferase [Bradyrhizobium sp. HKCCYLS20291]|uniref:glycosyltransferase n=1 Tax=Bradyrhizobium sp. HKCCYLS20291 TaxID=3420766 RepID=UPI003EB73084
MKILFYSLNSAIWMHALPENRLVRELVAAGEEVTYVTCGSCFPQHCTSMSASRIELGDNQTRKDAVCRTCIRNATILAESNGADHLELRDFISDADDVAASRLVDALSPERYLEFRYMGVDVGRLASYELFLKYKKMSPRLTAEQWEYCKCYIKYGLISLLGFSRLFRSKKPDAVVFYSPQYGINGICAAFTESEGSATLFVEGSSSNSERYKALRIWRWSVHGLVNPALQYWSQADTLLPNEIRRLRGHFRELVSGKSFAVYSSPATGKTVSVRAQLKIPKDAKILLMTLSSFDEAYAAYIIGRFPERKVTSPVFKDQFEWVKSTLDHFAARNDLCIVVRVHPRDFPNKRETTLSEQAQVWSDLFVSAPGNVRVNWPDDRLSLYDILREADLVVTGWSATGVEALALGIPVVTYDAGLPSYPKDIHFSGVSRGEYFENIERALVAGRQPSLVDGAFRWLGLSFSRGTVRITPPIRTERLVRFLVFHRLRSFVEGVIEGLVKRMDARRKFGPAGEADRFLRLIGAECPDLFSAADPAVPDQADKAAVTRAIRAEHARFASAIGLRAVPTTDLDSTRSRTGS